MNRNEKILINAINKQLNYLVDLENHSIDKIYSTLSVKVLKLLYEESLGKELIIPDELLEDDEAIQTLHMENDCLFISNLNKYKKQLKKIIKELLNVNKKYFSHEYSFDTIGKYRHKDFAKIMDIYMEEKHKSEYATYLNFIKRDLIIKNMTFTDEVSAITMNLYNEDPIIAMNNNYDSDSIIYFAHEIGHTLEHIEIRKYMNSKDIMRYYSTSANGEIIAKYYEKGLIDFLIENDLDVNYLKYALKQYYYNIEWHLNVLLKYLDDKNKLEDIHDILEIIIGGVVGTVLTIDKELYNKFKKNKNIFCMELLENEDIVDKYKEVMLKDKKLY